MNRFRASLRRFLQSEDGPTAVEYAVMVALIIIVCIGVLTTLGGKVSSTFNTVSGAL